MAEAQGRTAEAAITISALEKKATQFETESSRYIDENNRLSHALEGLNANLASSEGRVKGLQEELDASHVSAAPLYCWHAVGPATEWLTWFDRPNYPE